MATMGRVWAAVFALAAAGLAGAQDAPKPPAPQERPGGPEEEEELTPEKAMQLLKESRDLMGKSEELLLDSSRGKSLEAEKAALERLKKLLEEEKDPSAAQKQILEKIKKLLEKTGKSQDQTIQKINEIIRKARSSSSSSSQKQQQQQQQQQQQTNRPQQPSSPAQRPYDPNRNNDPVNKFRSRGDRTSRWGDLPPRLREAMFSSRRDLDEYPPEFQEVIKEYMKRLAEEEK